MTMQQLTRSRGCPLLLGLLIASITCDTAFGFSIIGGATTKLGGGSTRGIFVNAAEQSKRTSLFASFLGADVPLNVARLVQPSVALVIPKGVRNMTARGSGFILDGFNDEEECSYLVTAAHVAAPGMAIELCLGNETYPATVVARNMTLDLALLRTESNLGGAAGLTLATEIPEVGSVAFAHGYPASRLRGPAMTSGIVCGVADGLGVPDSMSSPRQDQESASIGDETTFVVTDAAMSGGMSGGPLVDVNGKVLGVNALVRPDLRALGNYAVSAEEVIGFLESISLHEEESSDDAASGYRVWLFNDRMNKKERVSSVLKSIAMLDDEKANQVMMQAHTMGRGMVGNYTNRDAAETMYSALREEDLLVEFERA
jgi:S1-C subfamily serine protease/ATP-dependent Clp protease adapter protein ClpS